MGLCHTPRPRPSAFWKTKLPTFKISCIRAWAFNFIIFRIESEKSKILLALSNIPVTFVLSSQVSIYLSAFVYLYVYHFYLFIWMYFGKDTDTAWVISHVQLSSRHKARPRHKSKLLPKFFYICYFCSLLNWNKSNKFLVTILTYV